MPPFVIALLVALSAMAWVYDKTMHRTGNNTQNSLTVAGVVGLITFFVVLSLVSIIDSALAN